MSKPAGFFYRNSLSICLVALFLFSIAGQVYTGLHEYNSELKEHGEAALSLSGYLQKGSPESKPVDAPIMETGE